MQTWYPVRRNYLTLAFEDLLYILSKYLLIHLYQTSQLPLAFKTLEMVIKPLVEKEERRGGVRGKWFQSDFDLLKDLISLTPSPHNIYMNFEWEVEMRKFWESLDTHSDHPPLFAYALKKYFTKPRGVEVKMGPTPPSLPKPNLQFRREDKREDRKKVLVVNPKLEFDFEGIKRSTTNSDAYSSSTRSKSFKISPDGVYPYF